MNEKEIRFIDSHYNELFRIKDGESIIVTFPDGHTDTRVCKYIDDYHTYIGVNAFHICEWAEIAEARGFKYYPENAPQYRLEPVEQSEFEYMFAPKDESENRGCIGYLRGYFDNSIDNKLQTVFMVENKENYKKFHTSEFSMEFDNIVNYFKYISDTPLLKNRIKMHNAIYDIPTERAKGRPEYYGYRITTDKRVYYMRCHAIQGDYNLYLYAYDKESFEKYKNIQLVNENETKYDKFFLTEDGAVEVYYNPDSVEGGQIVYNEIPNDLIKEASKSKTKEGFFETIDSGCKQYLIDINTPEFRENFKSYVERKPDFEGVNDRTMKGLLKHAGVKEKSHKDIDMER